MDNSDNSAKISDSSPVKTKLNFVQSYTFIAIKTYNLI